VGLFVTGTDTGVGKTYTLTQLLRLLRNSGVSCAAMKPICCGDRDDAEQFLAANGSGFTLDEINPVSLKTPVAPLAAALAEKVNIDINALLSSFALLERRVDQVLVEGVGGWLVPIHANYFVADLAVEMNLPVLVVAQNRLGCLNHAALTVRCVVDHGLRCVGVVLNDPVAQSNVATRTNADILRRIIPVPVLPGLTEKMNNLPNGWASFRPDVSPKIDTTVN
jgi:dethiobiotin synthetase